MEIQPLAGMLSNVNDQDSHRKRKCDVVYEQKAERGMWMN